jgi:hypothetical protein
MLGSPERNFSISSASPITGFELPVIVAALKAASQLFITLSIPAKYLRISNASMIPIVPLPVTSPKTTTIIITDGSRSQLRQH